MMKNIYGEKKIFTQYKEKFSGTDYHQIIESSDTDPFDDTIEFKVPAYSQLGISVAILGKASLKFAE